MKINRKPLTDLEIIGIIGNKMRIGNKDRQDVVVNSPIVTGFEMFRSFVDGSELEGGMPMQNVQFQVQEDNLVMIVDLSQEVGESASGKSVIIATTSGNVSVPGRDDVKVGLNVYRPVPVSGGFRRMASR